MVGKHTADLLAHQDDDVGFSNRTIARHVHSRWEDVVLRSLASLEASPTTLDELTKAAAEP
jgi:hypothetical protein